MAKTNRGNDLVKVLDEKMNLASIIGGMNGAKSKRLVHLYESNNEGDAATLQNLSKRIVFLNRLYALLVLVAVASMASARFI